MTASSVSETARQTARILMEIEAILFRPDDPFIFTSGRASPVYVDCRKIVGFPRTRSTLMNLAVEQLVRAVGAESFDVVAGVVTRAPVAWQRLGLEWLYRVKQEPRRLWKRYLVTNSIFLKMVLSEKLKRAPQA